jgi:hypothetical protein
MGCAELVRTVIKIRIGPYSVNNPPITFTQETEGLMAAKDHTGLIGAEFLRRFTVIDGRPGKRIWLSPNDNYGKNAECDQSGLRLRAQGKDFPGRKLLYSTVATCSRQTGIRALTPVLGEFVYPQTVSELRDAVRRENLDVETFFMMHIPSTPWSQVMGVRGDSPDLLGLRLMRACGEEYYKSTNDRKGRISLAIFGFYYDPGIIGA